MLLRAITAFVAMPGTVGYVRVRMVEERWAARQFGAEWQAYRARVPRWIGTRSGP